MAGESLSCDISVAVLPMLQGGCSEASQTTVIPAYPKFFRCLTFLLQLLVLQLTVFGEVSLCFNGKIEISSKTKKSIRIHQNCSCTEK